MIESRKPSKGLAALHLVPAHLAPVLAVALAVLGMPVQSAQAAGRTASPAYDSSTTNYYAPYASVQEWQQNTYHDSGTLGRMGLGADPRHPEGPGNAVAPR
jgi:hypothetical protein